MASLEPDKYQQVQNRYKNDELSTVEFLAEQLAESCVVFHSVDWLHARRYDVAVGEIDICVVGPAGKVVIIEQKNGPLKHTEEGALVKLYGNKAKNPNDQIVRARNGLLNAWGKTHKKQLMITPLIYLPDHKIPSDAALAADLACVVDANNKGQLAHIVARYLGPEVAPTEASNKHKESVLSFFRNELDLVPCVGALLEHQELHYTKHQNRSANVIKQLSFSPRHLLIEGRAGSGKTQLAMELFSDALERGLKPLYLCYNRPLADELQRLNSHDVGIISNIDRFIHSFMSEHAEVDVSGKATGDAYKNLRDLALTIKPSDAWLFNVLIIDEGQDFDTLMFNCAKHFLSDNAEITVLRDLQQNVYQKGFELKPTVTYALNTNYRCSNEIVAFTDALLGTDIVQTSEGLSFGNSSGVGTSIQHYACGQDYVEPLIKLVHQHLAQGYTLDDIVILVGKGQEHSWLMQQSQLAAWSLRRFTRDYDEQGQQIYSAGELLVETVYRFKGKQKPVVIVTELEFDHWNNKVESLLYTACTRAKLSLNVLISDTSLQVYIDRAKSVEVNDVSTSVVTS